MYARSNYDNKVDLTGTGATKSAQSVHLNLIYSAVAEGGRGRGYMRGKREVESSADGKSTATSSWSKYSF